MPALAEAFVAVRGDTSKVEGDIKSGFAKADTDKIGRDHGDRYSKGMSSGILGGAKSIIGAASGVLAAAGLANIGGDIYKEAVEAQKAGALTANVIKTTGGAAHVTQKQVEDLAQAISDKTGIDDEQVQAGANLLLTFKNVRNELGKGNDVFSQATGLAQDLAAAGFGDADTAAKMLGKALNDPVKGITALGKAGVTFSDDQKKQIANFVKTGDLLSAQKVILGEVSSQVGGAAAATTNPMEKLGVVIGNIEENLGTALLPTIQNVATWLGENLPKAIDTLGGWLATGKQGVEGLVNAFNGEGVTSDGFVGFMERVGIVARKVFDYFQAEVLPRLKEFGNFITETVAPALQKMAQFIGNNLDFFGPFVGVILLLIGALKVWTVVQTVLDAVLAANPIGLIIIGIAALVAGVIYAYTHFETFRNIVDTAWDVIQNAAKFAWENVLKPVFGFIVQYVQQGWETFQTFKDTVSTVWDVVRKAVETAWGFMSRTFDAINAGIETVRLTVGEKINAVVTFFAELPGRVVSAVGDLAKTLLQKGKDIVQGLLDGAMERISGIGTWASDIKDKIVDAIKSVFGIHSPSTVFAGLGQNMMAGLLGGLLQSPDVLLSAVKSIGSTVMGGLGGLAGGVAGFFQNLFGSGGGTIDAGRISLQGGMLDTDTYARINAALGNMWSLTQGSWSTRVAASAGTHAGSGVADVNPLGDSWYGAQAKLRAQGLDAWFRDWAGNQHIHLVNPHVTGLSSQALAQTLSFLQGGSGLAFDSGGWLPTGTTMTTNTTGSPERVLSPHDQIRLHPDDITGIGRAAAQAVLAERAVTGLAMMAGG